jgi:hypothetical protein
MVPLRSSRFSPPSFGLTISIHIFFETIKKAEFSMDYHEKLGFSV